MFFLGVILLRVVMRLIGVSSAALRGFIRFISAVHLFLYRSTRGAVSGRLGMSNGRIVLLTTTGRKSGRQLVVPLLCISDGPDLVIIASHGGLDQLPGWFLNLQANPEARVQIGARTIRVQAEQADAEKRRLLWPRFVKTFSGYEDYRKRTSREIPIVILHPLESLAGEPQIWQSPSQAS